MNILPFGCKCICRCFVCIVFYAKYKYNYNNNYKYKNKYKININNRYKQHGFCGFNPFKFPGICQKINKSVEMLWSRLWKRVFQR